MTPLNEAQTKQWLHASQFPVPQGVTATSADAAHTTTASFPGPAVVKALVPTGRRGKAGGVIMARDAGERGKAAAQLIGTAVNGHLVNAVYIEECIAIEQEYFLAFLLTDAGPQVLVSRFGGVDIEDTMRTDPKSVLREQIDPIRGLSTWNAAELWLMAGIKGPTLPKLADLTSRLYSAFCQADALTLEVNPLALDVEGKLHIVGAMMGVDSHALFRHTQWLEKSSSLPDNPRERAVALANRNFRGGECQYIELDGNIGLLVGGGGAGLYLHDMVIAAGGSPANHCVTPPTSTDNRKLKAVLGAILDNPALRGLLIAFNFAQMARTDIRVRTLVELLDEKQIDTAHLPIVIRLFGAGEQESRAMVADQANIHYVPRGTTLKEAAQLIVQLTAAVQQYPMGTTA
ncbi:MAG TPA: ATP-grasp domain-containing protein [Eoetvoesiella sp.]